MTRVEFGKGRKMRRKWVYSVTIDGPSKKMEADFKPYTPGTHGVGLWWVS